MYYTQRYITLLQTLHFIMQALKFVTQLVS